MKILLSNRPVATLLCSFLLGPALGPRTFSIAAAQPQAQVIPFSAVVETIEFQGVSPETRQLILARIAVRPGDMLTADTRHRIGRELGKVQQGLTFTYKAGTKRATARLLISAGC